MEVHIEIYILKDEESIESKIFRGKDSIEKGLEFLNRLWIKKRGESYNLSKRG